MTALEQLSRVEKTTVTDHITPLRRLNVKSMRSKDERFRWNEAKAPTTSATVSARIARFVRIDFRMAERRRGIQRKCRL